MKFYALIIPFIIINLMAAKECNSSFQDFDFIYGEWEICADSVDDKPPNFLICPFEITIYKNGDYSLLAADRLVGNGCFTFSEYPSEYRKKLYEINYIESAGSSIKLSKYIPNKSLLFLSNDGQRIVFMKNVNKDPATIFFLNKSI